MVVRLHLIIKKDTIAGANKGVSWIDYDKLGNPIRVQFTDHSITEHVYAADGRKKGPHPNPLPRRGNSIISSHLPLGEIREGYSTIQQNTNYYPYGGMTSISTGQGEQQFKYNGKEYDPMHGLNEYDYGARQYDPARAQFTTMDPLCEKYYHISPYAYCAGNPVNAVDPDGRYIDVMPFGDNKYKIIGGYLDNDPNIYYYDKQNERTSIGKMLTIYSFFDDSGAPVMGAIINLKDKSGQTFLDRFIHDTPNLPYYMLNAIENGDYDFKNLPSTRNLSIKETELYHYRGMMISIDGESVIASARDIGNYAAGYIAGYNFIPEIVARFGFDALESWQHIYYNHEKLDWYHEKNPTIHAQGAGHRQGSTNLGKNAIKVIEQLGSRRESYIPFPSTFTW